MFLPTTTSHCKVEENLECYIFSAGRANLTHKSHQLDLLGRFLRPGYSRGMAGSLRTYSSAWHFCAVRTVLQFILEIKISKIGSIKPK